MPPLERTIQPESQAPPSGVLTLLRKGLFRDYIRRAGLSFVLLLPWHLQSA